MIATEHETPRIREWRRKFVEIAKNLDPRHLVFVEEAGSNIGRTHDYARLPRGERALGSVPRNRGTGTPMLGALDIHGVRALMTIEGETDADVFEAFLQHVLIPRLPPGDIVILDNVGAHKTEQMRILIAQAGASMIFLLAFSPDMNPIELCSSKLKAGLKGFGARTVDDLHRAIRRAMDLICADDAGGWFKHWGYRAPAK